ncbi:MAG: hypothetical protein DHS80DRAFT_21692 [Piptocephalis tieghemiana]|nr:MAG: hypothetical protein DHS80DRAFT_21692 [Piptocephalis tieghemiana]
MHSLPLLFLTLLLVLFPDQEVFAQSVNTYTSMVLVPGNSGNGTCSPGKVTGLNLWVNSDKPMQAVFSASDASYRSILPANLSDPNTRGLTSPYMNMSCFSLAAETRTCNKTMDPSTPLKSQVMCILVKNAHPAPLIANITYQWLYPTDTDSPAPATTVLSSYSSHSGSSPSSLPSSLTSGLSLVSVVVAFRFLS